MDKKAPLPPIRKGKRKVSGTEIRRRRVRHEEMGKMKIMDWETLKRDAEISDMSRSDSSENECEYPDKV